MIFDAKMDTWLILLFIFATVISLVSPVIYHRKYKVSVIQSLFVLSLPVIFVLSLMWLPIFNTKYAINNQFLSINNGFSTRKIPLSAIITVEKSHDWGSAPALSLDRLKVSYKNPNGKRADVLISPKAADKFIEQLSLAKK